MVSGFVVARFLLSTVQMNHRSRAPKALGAARFDTMRAMSYDSRMRVCRSVGVLAALVTFSCVAPKAFGADSEGPKTFKAGEFTFSRPTDWQWVEVTSSMRKAQLKVTGADKSQPAEVVFFYFGEGNGGGTKANVDRWLGQFQEKSNPKIEDAKVGKHTVTYVEVEGTYMSGMPGGPRTPQPNTMLLGAIIESGEGNVFIKMTGPIAVVKSSKETFKKMVEEPLK